jgi:hypothetical protein
VNLIRGWKDPPDLEPCIPFVSTEDRSNWDWTILSFVLLLYRELSPFQRHPRLLLRLSRENKYPRLEWWGRADHHGCKLSLLRHSTSYQCSFIHFYTFSSFTVFHLDLDQDSCTSYLVSPFKLRPALCDSCFCSCTQLKWHIQPSAPPACNIVHVSSDTDLCTACL